MSRIVKVLLIAALVTAAGCRDSRARDKTLADMLRHFKECKLRFESQEKASYGPDFPNVEGCVLRIAGNPVYVFKFDLKDPRQRTEVERVMATEHTILRKDARDASLAKLPAKVNGPFVLVVSLHAIPYDVAEAFTSFDPHAVILKGR